MPRLPATLDKAIEAEALKYARAFVRQIRDEQIVWLGMPLSWFSKPDNRRAAMEFMKKAATDAPLAMIDLVNVARAGGDLAHDAARELILEYQHRHVEMPPSLAAFNMELIDPRHRHRKQRGPKRADNFMRDIAITAIIGDVCSQFDLKPTRQRYTKRERSSGCSIVSRALAEEGQGLARGESAVVTIWTRYGAIAFPGGVRAKTLPRLGA